MLRVNVDRLAQRLRRCDGFQTVGRLVSVRDILTARLPAALGERCDILLSDDEILPAEVVGVRGDDAQLLGFHPSTGLRPGMTVVAHGRPMAIPTGPGLLGRVLDGLGTPIDGRGVIDAAVTRPLSSRAADPLRRQRIDSVLETGQRAIDGLLTLGRGQRVGLFAGSGVGKSTLLGEITRAAVADVTVVVLVGERGREVRPFLEDCLGAEGLRRSVVVVATSDATALMRIQAVRTGLAVAESFRDRGQDVLFVLDSLTRLAHAQREVGLARGEPPGSRGYPGSVQSLLAQALERLGTSEVGSITGLITVLVDGDDLDEPIADAARGILDGHIVLDRRLAARGHYPAIDILHSVSRLFNDITTAEHRRAAAAVRELLATCREVEELVQLGAYQRGSAPLVDRALQLRPAVDAWLRQTPGEHSPFVETLAELSALASAWREGALPSREPASQQSAAAVRR